MGGNVVMQYAGVRPERIRRLVNLEGFGMRPDPRGPEAPARYGLDRRAQGPSTAAKRRWHGYSAVEGVARRLMKTNPRLAPDKADWLASHWSAGHAQPDGSMRWQILGEAAHKIVNAHIFRVDETLALYARITAPLLMVEASDDSLHGWWKNRYTLDEFHERLKSVPLGAHRAAGRRGPHAAPRPAAARGATDRGIPGLAFLRGPLQRRARQQRVESSVGNGELPSSQHQRSLGAAEHHGVAAVFVFQALDDAQLQRGRSGLHDARHQLVHDDSGHRRARRRSGRTASSPRADSFSG
jgi:hypothetical protein